MKRIKGMKLLWNSRGGVHYLDLAVYMYIPVSHTGHQSFVADTAVLSPSLLVSVGWDGQMLFWQEMDDGSKTSRGKLELPYIDSEPLAGFKLGPSVTVDFLPVSIRSLFGSAFLMVFVGRKGTVTVAAYST